MSRAPSADSLDGLRFLVCQVGEEAALGDLGVWMRLTHVADRCEL